MHVESFFSAYSHFFVISIKHRLSVKDSVILA